jgi:nucleoside-diphosphate-sugar epimerase
VLRGQGSARRNYIFVQDVVRWILVLVREKEAGVFRSEKILFCAGPETLSIKDYLTLITKTLCDSQEVIVEKGAEFGDCVVQSSAAEFVCTTFSEYLSFLRNKRG